MQQLLLLLLAGLACTHVGMVQAFRDGDFIQSARKSQFHGQRTHWHDLLGHHCPRYGHQRLVAMPLQKPIANFTGDDDYKIQLSFDGDRHLTPWLKVMGKGAPTAPLVEVVLRRSGQELLGVVATVKQASPSFRRSHPQLVPEFANTTHWPKFLPVKYSFDTQNDVDLERGLYVVFAAGLLVGLAVAISAVWGVGSKLVSFLSEVTGDGPADGKDAVAGSSGWKGGQKAE